MRMRFFEFFEATGTPKELSEFSSRLVTLLKSIEDDMDKKKARDAVDELWKRVSGAANGKDVSE